MPADQSSDPDLPLIDNGISEQSREKPTRVAGFRHLILFPGLLLAVFMGGIIGMYFQPPGLQAVFSIFDLEPGGGTDTPIAVAIEKIESKEEIALVSQGDVVALGRIIPKGDVITVSPPFGAGDARIAEITVSVGDQTSERQIIATLDSKSQLEGALQTARANLAVQEAALQQTRTSTRISRLEAQAELARAEATESAAIAELDRATELLERGVSTRSVFDSAVARAREASRDVERRRATLSRYTVEAGEVQADVALAKANLLAAQAQLDQAMRDLEKAIVRAPIAGTVIDVHVRPGERPGSDGILDLGDTSQMTVEAEIYQSLIGRVAIGDPVKVSGDALPGELSGTVSAIGLEIGRQSITSDDPAANTDARVVDVIVALDETSSEQSSRLTNLQVIIRIDAGRLEPAQSDPGNSGQ